MSGRKSKQKGYRFEAAIVKLLQDHGRAAERMPLSGALGGKYHGDVSTPVLGEDWRIQAKCRANAFEPLYKELEDHDALIIRKDRRPMLVVLDLRRALGILNKIERAA